MTRGRRFPPLLIAGLTVMWLLLNQTLAPGQIVLGFALAIALSWLAAVMRPLQPRVRRPDLIARLIVLVLLDIVRSNIAVARIVLGLVRHREVRSGFVRIPLELRDPHGLAVLAAIVTSTPGTVWAGLSPNGEVLTLHVLDLRDDAAWVQWIKGRYEHLLLRIFK